MWSKIKKILRGQNPPIDIWHYILGHLRYSAYYSRRFKWLIRRHISRQITYRIVWMDRECYENGSCKLCGCETTALQMADKSCKKPCYPEILSKKRWTWFKNGWFISDKYGIWHRGTKLADKPILIEGNGLKDAPILLNTGI